MIRMFSSKTMSTIVGKLKQVQEKINAAASKRSENLKFTDPRLVAVTKTKGIEVIFEAYDAGQRHFGENYVVEMHDKANDIELQDRCQDIRWHFIGHLQRNKINKVLDIPNLYVIETVDNEKLAKAINDSWARLQRSQPLNVMAQCNTSKEENKSGCAPEEMVQLSKYIVEECPQLRLMGLMTIGVFDYDYSKGPNPDFLSLVSLREEVCKALKIPTQKLELSMGMSSDFEQAIDAGSTNVRVGSTLFGVREAKVKPTVETPSTTNSVDDNTQGVKNVSISR